MTRRLTGAGCVLIMLVAGIVPAAVVTTLVGCGSRAPAAATSEYYLRADKRKEEILNLWMQIREWRVEGLKLPANPHSNELALVYRSSVGRLRICPKQAAPRTPACSDVCTLKDAICDNAEDICRIAAELPRDTWAQDKCTSAKASCKESRERCCSCLSNERAAHLGDMSPPFGG